MEYVLRQIHMHVGIEEDIFTGLSLYIVFENDEFLWELGLRV